MAPRISYQFHGGRPRTGAAANVVGGGGGGGGGFDHNSVQVINGSFPAKPDVGAGVGPAIIYDDCSGSSVTTLWSGGWPDGSGAPYDLSYSTSINSVAMAHSHVSKYMRGCATPGGLANTGNAVMAWKNRTISSFTAKTYMSWYYMADPNWVTQTYGGTGADDGNYKLYDFSTGTSPYDPANWYTSGHLGVDTQRVWNDDDGALDNPDRNGNNFFGITGPSYYAWQKSELEISHDTTNNGYINWYENGVLNSKTPASGHSYYGHTIGGTLTGSAFNDSVGGYNRAYGPTTQWRYWNDVVLDYTLERLLLTNSSTFASSTILEYQEVTAWGTTQITFKAKLGQFSVGQTGYLWVVGANGITGSPAPALHSSVTIGS